MPDGSTESELPLYEKRKVRYGGVFVVGLVLGVVVGATLGESLSGALVFCRVS